MDRVGRQLVHGDFWDNNVKFSGDDVAGILDLDFMEERPRIDDLALTLYYAHASLLGTHGEAGVFQAMAELVGAYASAGIHDWTPLSCGPFPAPSRGALSTSHDTLRCEPTSGNSGKWSPLPPKTSTGRSL